MNMGEAEIKHFHTNFLLELIGLIEEAGIQAPKKPLY